GFSRGGIMGMLTAIEMGRQAASFVSWGGVSDMILTYEERQDLRRMMKRVIGGTPKKVPEEYQWRTPFDQVNKIQAPVLLIHG
ncbi:alpha/beta hydrolase family protein, partial [Micrococcus luteus]